MSSFSNDSFNTGNGAFNENNWPTGRGPFDAIATSESSRFVVHTSVERAVSAESIRATTLTNGQTTTTWVSMLMQVPVADAASTATYAMSATSALSAATAQIAETARYAETAYAATVATNASSAMYATSAGHASGADTASHASFATYATSAGHAYEADTAAHASDASYASEAFKAYHASFADSATTATYAERIRVMNSSGGTLWTSAVNTDSVSSANVAGTANNVYAKNSTGGVTQTSCIDTVYSAYSAGNAVLANRAFEAAEADRASSAYSVRVVTRDNENNTGTQYTDVISKVSQAWWADSASRAALAYTASSATFANYAKSVRVQTNTASTDTEWRGIIDLRSVDPSLYTVASASSAISFVSSDSTYAISDTSAYVDTSIANSANYVRSQTGSLVSETAWVTAIGDARSAQYATSAGTATVANSFIINDSTHAISDAYNSVTASINSVSSDITSSINSVSSDITASINSVSSSLSSSIAQISSDVGNKSLLDTNNKTNLVAAVNEVNAKVDAIPTGLVPQGTIAFEDLPDLADVNVGWMYNISDDFTTDSRFIISGIDEQAGSNVYAIEDNGVMKWDVFAAAPIIQVDQTYSPTSGNPQSGTAVNEAIQQVTSTLSQLTVSSATYASVASNANTANSFVSSDSTYAISDTSVYITSVPSADTANNIRIAYTSTSVSGIYANTYTYTSTRYTGTVDTVASANYAEYVKYKTMYTDGSYSDTKYITFTVTSTLITSALSEVLNAMSASRVPVLYTYTREQYGTHIMTGTSYTAVSSVMGASTAQSFVSSDSTYAISDTSAYITVPEQATVVSSASSAGIAKSLSGSAFTVSSASTAGWAVNADSAGLANIAKSLSGSAFTVSSASSAGTASSASSAGTASSATRATSAYSVRYKSYQAAATVYTSCIDKVGIIVAHAGYSAGNPMGDGCIVSGSLMVAPALNNASYEVISQTATAVTDYISTCLPIMSLVVYVKSNTSGATNYTHATCTNNFYVHTDDYLNIDPAITNTLYSTTSFSKTTTAPSFPDMTAAWYSAHKYSMSVTVRSIGNYLNFQYSNIGSSYTTGYGPPAYTGVEHIRFVGNTRLHVFPGAANASISYITLIRQYTRSSATSMSVRVHTLVRSASMISFHHIQ